MVRASSSIHQPSSFREVSKIFLSRSGLELALMLVSKVKCISSVQSESVYKVISMSLQPSGRQDVRDGGKEGVDCNGRTIVHSPNVDTVAEL